MSEDEDEVGVLQVDSQGRPLNIKALNELLALLVKNTNTTGNRVVSIAELVVTQADAIKLLKESNKDLHNRVQELEKTIKATSLWSQSVGPLN